MVILPVGPIEYVRAACQWLLPTIESIGGVLVINCGSKLQLSLVIDDGVFDRHPCFQAAVVDVMTGIGSSSSELLCRFWYVYFVSTKCQ
jgi:hypothetical protein